MEKIGIKGFLTLKFYDKGVLVKEDKGNNLIVGNGYTKLLSMLSGVDGIGISKVQAGTEQEFADGTNTEIATPVDLAITSRTIAGGKLILDFQFGAAQGNGTTFCEFGIILGDGSLFARKVWPAFAKIEDLTINGTWEIKLF
jgi:hypothetical protein